jgi:Flp pilus assembly pilin Flp
MHQT